MGGGGSTLDSYLSRLEKVGLSQDRKGCRHFLHSLSSRIMCSGKKSTLLSVRCFFCFYSSFQRLGKFCYHRKVFPKVVQLLSRLRLFATPWTAACQATLSITNSQSLLNLMSIESVMPSNHFILCRRLLLLPSILPSIRVFSNESVLCIRWPKYWSFSFSISLSNEYSGLISFRIDWFDLLAAQGTLKRLLQHHSSKASVL